MIKIILTLVVTFLISVPFFSTPVGEQLYHSYQETDLHRTIYCQYVEWFGVEGFDKLKFYLRCKLQ
ncbi:hypothetical protein HBN50_01545 [Halobacteriovorax sp. GB3]|uniref:hypothetical protein n=1 Tax=Halobacteriovorax sp. GB3 TaxID=2719615 RepID=UPI00236001D6|nr:hypothetical protein [Halobacteriovorax sp. GB3]MDD0851753.1 hypothetical protein [Halobacteriovorax sp. GB3]